MYNTFNLFNKQWRNDLFCSKLITETEETASSFFFCLLVNGMLCQVPTEMHECIKKVKMAWTRWFSKYMYKFSLNNVNLFRFHVHLQNK